MARRNPPNPMCWLKLATMLRQCGCSDETIAAARLAYSDGVYNGLHMLGQTTSDACMARTWHEYYSEAKLDFDETLAKFKASKQKGDGR